MQRRGGGDRAVRALAGLYEAGPVGGLPDGDLLDRFVAQREEAVFAALVHRHGPMVWGVCRRLLHDHHHAEDAFQATFLVLARRASAVQPAARVGPWLHGVARQTALKARGLEARRRAREARFAGQAAVEVAPDSNQGDLIGALDGEINRLPDRYRLPIVLCELEGRTDQEAADLLGWPIGTVSGRLTRARGILADRLRRQVRTESRGAWVALVGQRLVVPSGLATATTRGGWLVAVGRSSELGAGVVSAHGIALMRGVIQTMITTKIKLGLAWALGVGIVAGGAGLAYRARADEPTRVQVPGRMVFPGNAHTKEKVERRERLMNQLEVARLTPQKVEAKAATFDPKLTYPFTIDPARVFLFPSLVVEPKLKGLGLKGNNVAVLPMMTERGVTGAMLIGSLQYSYAPEPGKTFQGSASAAMLRFSPDAIPLGLNFDQDKVGVTDKGLAEMARFLLGVSVKRCYQRNYVKDGVRKQEVMIPPPDAFAAVLYTQEYGEILISFDFKVAAVHDFTGNNGLYEKK